MNEIDYIFTDKQYDILKKEYEKTFSPQNEIFLSKLNNVISLVENQGFNMSISFQNKILSMLNNAKQILSITTNSSEDIFFENTSIKNSPFELIKILSNLSKEINSYEIKNSYKIIYLKINNLLLEIIYEISNYFANKKLKIFKYM